MATRALDVLAACALLVLLPPTTCRDSPPLLLTQNETARCVRDEIIRSDQEDYPIPRINATIRVFEWEIICKLKEPELKIYTTQIIPEYRFNLKCNLSDPNFEVEKIPRWNLTGQTHLSIYFYVGGCPVPPTPYAEIIRFLGFTSTPKLMVTRIAGDAAIQRQHLRGLDELNVTELDLESANIAEIPDDLFQDLKQLRILNLRNNNLSFAGKIFQNLNHLRHLSCARCGLSALPEDLFALPALEQLFLERNKLQLRSATFAQLPSLRELSLSGNSLETLPPGVFAGLINLRKINLNYNHFTSLPSKLFKFSSKLEMFTLTDSKNLSGLPDDLLCDMENLTKVILSRNAILRLPDKMFDKSNKISALWLDHNKLSNLNEANFSALVNLIHLTLSYNEITKIPDKAFNNLENLQVLDIDNNMIKKLERSAFEGLQSLKELNLNSNQLSAMSNGGWYLDYPFSLEKLELVNNGMTFIPTHLQRFKLENLRSLNLSYNNITIIWSISTDLDFKKNQDFVVDLSNNQIQQLCFPRCEDVVFPHNVYVIMKNNPINCDCKLFPFVEYRMKRNRSSKITIDTGDTKCAAPMDLATVEISGISPENLTCEHQHTLGRCTLIENPYFSAKIINCSNGQLYRDDKFVDILEKIQPKQAFSHHLNHTELILDNNKITSLETYGAFPDEITVLSLRNTSLQLRPGDIPLHIKELDLRDNNLEYLDEAVAHNILFGSEYRKVKLFGNNFACDCSNKNFIIMLNEQQDNVENFLQLQCSKETADAGPTIAGVEISTLCHDTTVYLISGIGVAIIVILLIILIVLCQYKYALKAWLVNNFELPRKILLKKVPVDIRHLKKDVFLSYSHADENEMDKIMIFIQEKGYTTINHRDDWLGGGFIVDSIEESIRDCQTSIFLVTSHFVESKWGTHEFRVAFSTQVLERSSNIIVVIKGDIDAILNKDKRLKAYIKRFTYLKWEDPNFENRLTLSLPERLAERMSKFLENERSSSDKKCDGLNVTMHDIS